MSAAITRPTPEGWAVRLAGWLFAAFVGVALILNAQLARGGPAQDWGAYGFLLLQVAGWLGLREHGHRATWIGIAARSMLGLFIVNLVLFLALEIGPLGPIILLVALDVVLLFFSGIVGAVAVLVAIALTISDRPRPPLIPAVLATLALTLVVYVFIGGRGETPPPDGTPTPTVFATATPTARYEVSVRVPGGGTVVSIASGEIRCPPACTSSVAAGSRLTLRAVPDAATVLKGWDGACGGAGDCVLIVTGPLSVTATFARPTLTVTTSGSGGGRVLSGPEGIGCPGACTASFARGTRVALTPRPDFGSALASWSGACAGAASCAVTLDADAAVGAAFAYLSAPGIDAALCSEPAPISLREGDSASVAVCFENRGTVTWTVGTQTQVNLAVCCPLNATSPYATWGVGWLSPSAYATSSTTSVAPGQRAFFSYRVTVPKPTTPGEYRFGAELVVASTGAPVRLTGYTQIIVVR